jgi:hypothetical protein
VGHLQTVSNALLVLAPPLSADIRGVTTVANFVWRIGQTAGVVIQKRTLASYAAPDTHCPLSIIAAIALQHAHVFPGHLRMWQCAIWIAYVLTEACMYSQLHTR